MLSRVVGKLVGEGLIERQADPLDLRSARVAITDRGHGVHERIRRDRAAILRRVVDMLDPDEASALRRALPAWEGLARELSALPENSRANATGSTGRRISYQDPAESDILGQTAEVGPITGAEVARSSRRSEGVGESPHNAHPVTDS